jgi:hypothetical protein
MRRSSAVHVAVGDERDQKEVGRPAGKSGLVTRHLFTLRVKAAGSDLLRSCRGMSVEDY